MSGQTVGAWMHRGVISCGPDTSLEEVARTMDSKDVSALVVVNEAGDVVGVISRTDLVNTRFVEPYMKHWRGMTAEHLMSRPVISVSPETLVTEAANILREKQIHRLVVVEKEGQRLRPLGILSVTDLAKNIDGR
ncbi:MAG: histidine kinase [Deltaproteobacteria bacterium RIFCSPLOWO2_12_FULL_60_16]|nr:MAG: histidine kinase [Deltaproteobacteria bacterium RIFCSPLOWO2_12_FULL_60_16]